MSSTYSKEKKLVYDLFRRTPAIHCPAFPNEKIVFNSKGANHIFYKSAGVRRNKKERQVRISLLYPAIQLISVMPFPQEYQQVRKDNGKITNYWAFEAVVDKKRIKVIIRQVGDGMKHFFSVIPAWRRDRKTSTRMNYKKDLRD